MSCGPEDCFYVFRGGPEIGRWGRISKNASTDSYRTFCLLKHGIKAAEMRTFRPRHHHEKCLLCLETSLLLFLSGTRHFQIFTFFPWLRPKYALITTLVKFSNHSHMETKSNSGFLWKLTGGPIKMYHSRLDFQKTERYKGPMSFPSQNQVK